MIENMCSRLPLSMVLLLSMGGSLLRCQCEPAPPLPDMTPVADAASPDRPRSDQGAGDVTRDDHERVDGGLRDALLLDLSAQDHGLGDGPVDDVQGEDGADLDATAMDLGDAAIDVAPASPAQIHAEGGRSLRLSFAAVPGALWYQALHAWSADGPFTAIGLSSTSPEIVLTDLALDTVQWLAVVAYNGAGASPRSDAVQVRPRDAMPWSRAEIEGQITRLGQPVEGAVVRLYRWLDHGPLWAEARSDAGGHYRLRAPASRYLGLIAGFDQFPADGFAFERGYDDVGLYRPRIDGWAQWLSLRPGEQRGGVDIAIDLEFLERQVSGQLGLGAGWPLGPVIVRACETTGLACPYRKGDVAVGPYRLDVAPGIYRLEAFVDVDNNGQQGINEPLVRAPGPVDTRAGDAAGVDLSLPDAAVIAGTFAGAGSWSLEARDDSAGRPAIYSTSLSDGQGYSLVVPGGRSYAVQLFVDQDDNGRRSVRDLDLDGRGDRLGEGPAETGWTVDSAVPAGRTDLDLVASLDRVIAGRVEPAMQRWRVVARAADSDALFVTEVDPEGRFILPVRPHPGYLLYAYVDADGDARRSVVGEPAVAYGALVDTHSGDVSDLVITSRRVRGQILDRRDDPALGVYERVIVQQLVEGVGDGLLCPSSLTLDNIVDLDEQGSFSVEVGALGSGAGSIAISACAPNCTGLVVTRFVDRDGDLSPLAEACGSAEPLTHPQSPSAPTAAAAILDSSAGDVVAF